MNGEKELIRLDPDTLNEESRRFKRFLRERMVNQSRAIERVVSAYDYFLSPLREADAPIINLLELGPSGSGKTLLAELTAEFFFEDRGAFTKIECGSYQTQYELSRLIGSTAGYLGYDHPSDQRYRNRPLLHQEQIDAHAFNYLRSRIYKTDKTVRRLVDDIKEIQKKAERAKLANNPVEYQIYSDELFKKEQELQVYVFRVLSRTPLISVVLFDEIEKAHHSLLDFLLEITSKGRITLGNNEETSFVNSFIFMTSNLGSKAIAKEIKGSRQVGFIIGETVGVSVYNIAMDEVRKYFKPEFLGRLGDDVVVFQPLGREHLAQIRDFEITALNSELSKKSPLELIVSDEAKEWLLAKAIDHPEYGARLIKSKVVKYLRKPIVRMLRSGQVSVGDRIFVNVEGTDDNAVLVFYKDTTVKQVTVIPIKDTRE